MIQYTLKCADGHTFDSWFQSAAAYDKLVSNGLLSCAICDNGQIQKAIMTPRVRTGRKKAPVPAVSEAASAVSLSEPASLAEQAMAELRKKVEENSDYVGTDFASEARAMYDGDVPLRSIYGEARADEAKQLIEDGVPVAPLPFIPARKTN
ncbi:MAG: DUF1178 family protein [Rhodobacteraceae bacterium]|nr:DUF1178 family protein [Paracoccaceae bacterium]